MRPKSFGVSTRPAPKWYCQTRFTIDRRASTFAGLTIHCASAARRIPSVCESAVSNSCGRLGTHRQCAGGHQLAGILDVAARQEGHRPRWDRLERIHELVIGELRLALVFLLDSLRGCGKLCGQFSRDERRGDCCALGTQSVELTLDVVSRAERGSGFGAGKDLVALAGSKIHRSDSFWPSAALFD